MIKGINENQMKNIFMDQQNRITHRNINDGGHDAKEGKIKIYKCLCFILLFTDSFYQIKLRSYNYLNLLTDFMDTIYEHYM